MAISENNEIRSNLLRCPLVNNDELFFTLMDHLNNLFMSNDPKDILRFYDYFENRDQLIKWMMERPKGNYRIVEFNKDENDIIVVIPAIDANGKFAKTCMDDIFKGLHIIFVESGIGNYYFNYAHNCNAGIKKALGYNPKWIILSNDDMYKIDDVEILKKELLKIDHKDYDVIFIQPSKFHSVPDNIGKENILRKIGLTLIFKRRMQKRIERKFKVTLFPAPIHSYLRFFYKPGYRYIQFVDFCIFSSSFTREKDGKLFNEDFINCGEDNDLSLKISLKRDRYTFINYKIGDYMGQSLGSDILRKLRNEAGIVLLNYMIDKNLHPASEEIKKYI